MFKKRTLTTAFVLLAAIVLYGSSQPKDELDGLRCQLQLADGELLDTSSNTHFHFLLLSDKDGLQLFKDTNMWGYFARSFTIATGSKSYEVTRRDRDWDKNWPEPVTINRGDVLVTNVYLCDGSWRVSPKLPVKRQSFKFVGHYSLRPEDDPPKDMLMKTLENLWHGRITSAPLDLELTEACIVRLNREKPGGGQVPHIGVQ